MTIKIAIVDDHPVLIRGLKNILECAPFIKVTGTYLSGKELLAAISKTPPTAIANTPPDVLLLDIQMPDQRGDELAPILQKEYPDMRILAFTNLEQLYYIRSMIRHGVLGYVLKTSDEAILLDAIKTVHAGNQYFDPAIRDQVLQMLAADSGVSKNYVLTEREKEILDLIAQNYNSQEIADKLFVSKRTIDGHRVNLLLKLDVKNSATLVKKAIELGLIQ